MTKPKTKEYIFSNTVTVVEETTVVAKTFEDAVDLYLSGEGETEEVEAVGDYWECIDNPDDIEENEE